MGFLQDWLRKLRENQKPESLEELYDDRPKDRELLLLRKEHRRMNEEEEKAYLKQKLQERYQERTKNFVFGLKDNKPTRTQLIKEAKKRQINPSYFNKYKIK